MTTSKHGCTTHGQFSGSQLSGRQRGYTLLELLITIAIIGILSVLGMLRYTEAKESARVAQARSCGHEIIRVAISYSIQYESFDNFNGLTPYEPGEACNPEGTGIILTWRVSEAVEDHARGVIIAKGWESRQINWDTSTGLSGP